MNTPNHKVSETIAPFLVLLTLAPLVACGGSGNGGTTSTGGSGGSGASSQEVLYVATGANGEGQLRSMAIDPNTGNLSPLSTFAAPEVIYEMRVDPSKAFLYASDFDGGAVRSYSIDSSSGALTEVSGSPFRSPAGSGNTGPLATTTDGKFLFFCLFSESGPDIVTFSISGGSLTAQSTAQDDNQPFDFAVDPSNKFLYVSDHADNNGDFSVFSIAANGVLTEVAGSPFSFQPNSEPYGIAIHPNGQFLYSALSNTQDIAALSVDLTSGSLAQVSGSPFNTGIFLPAWTVMHPSGKFLYTSTQGSGAIVQYSVDSNSGSLSNLVTYAGGGPVQLAIDPLGNFLYASYPSFGQIAGYKINQTDGTLTAVPGSPFAAGVDPGPLAIVQLH